MNTEPQTPAHERREAPPVSIAVNPSESRFEVSVDGSLAGFATYRDSNAARAFTHTEVAAEYEGLRLGSQLIRYALDESRRAGRKVQPFCPFVRAFIGRHPAYLDLVAQPQRFGLTH
jgi:predicted GNAT family acetyltransferase